MKLFAVIPVKPFAEGKSRLSGVLSDTDRRDLNRQMFEHVLCVAASVIGTSNTIVVSADPIARKLAVERGGHTIPEGARAGLNAALKSGAEAAAAQGANAVLILPTDLPTLTKGDIKALAGHAHGSPFVIVAPDRLEQGTNALLVSPPDAIGFSFGPNSFAAHKNAASARNIEPVAVRRDGLAFDIDTADDYRQLVKQGWDA